ncbi:Med1 domain containing protein [Pyrenophora tritici-repentis]|uniref:Mediator of RNA polymerase II transcription subunit 1 n=3 Tax=Pyrenophora tritici-repentis TaxID=45151 RepID=A0A922NLU3_9PLEO|nr:uncharacterized protein PTRG_01735 [Pyrenophora tritici-repentis Pt-1C-BFP]EDU41173.1 conserved hypothetical protein [Pyrenophora tritici-repentis Pt-1C-BFP]KAI1518271.1 Med1 domain containing protein [Pyrenophora tritici-repentis]KAI1673998.1 Med1 domain containing protein [Pyrenophora tritici-repentis]KAI1688910.1 Med1 domain containing protein [Pyrenophora tritici-repentis]
MATPTPVPKDEKTPSKNHSAFSPAPRSVPPMMSYDSPAVLNMLNDVTSSGMGGVGMGISMSGLGMSSLGITTSAMGRADEAERTRRLREIIDIIGKKPGRVSEEGLLALCKRLGIPYEKHMDEAGTWSLLIGDEALCDITFKDDEIASVNLQTGLDDSRPDLNFGASGSEILVRSLRPLPGQSKLNITLERFSESLEKLLTLDKLGSPQNGGVSCYNAIAGVYTSLRKLFEHEKSVELANRAPDERFRTYKAEREVLCKKSGRPRLNGGSCLGLSLEYWMDRRKVISKSTQELSDKGKEKMGTDSKASSSYPEDVVGSDNHLYSLTIECESSPSTLYTPIRISNDWISDQIEKATDHNDATTLDSMLLNTSSINWLDPKPTYLEAPEQSDDAMNLDSAAGRLPNIRFVAKFNPPLVVPLAIYMQLHQLVGIEPRTDEFRPTTFVGLALRPGTVDPGMSSTTGESTHVITSSRLVGVVDSAGKYAEKWHKTSLYVPKLEYSRTLESLPFSHPKQLVEILPILRQYAHATTLLRDSFYEPPAKPTPTHKLGQNLTPPVTPKRPSDNDDEPPLPVDITLSYAPPTPRITIHVPHPSTPTSNPKSTTDAVSHLLSNLLSSPDDTTTYRDPLTVTLDLHANGDLVVVDQNLYKAPVSASSFHQNQNGDVDMDTQMAEAEAFDARLKKLGRVMDAVGHLGAFAEWVRRAVVGVET